jgi:hypothetical protein
MFREFPFCFSRKILARCLKKSERLSKTFIFRESFHEFSPFAYIAAFTVFTNRIFRENKNLRGLFLAFRFSGKREKGIFVSTLLNPFEILNGERKMTTQVI